MELRQALPESRQTNGRIRLRDAKDIANLPRRKTLQIERREFALDRLQASHGIEQFTPPFVFGASYRLDTVEGNFSGSSSAITRRIGKGDVLGNSIQPGALARIAAEFWQRRRSRVRSQGQLGSTSSKRVQLGSQSGTSRLQAI